MNPLPMSHTQPHANLHLSATRPRQAADGPRGHLEQAGAVALRGDDHIAAAVQDLLELHGEAPPTVRAARGLALAARRVAVADLVG